MPRRQLECRRRLMAELARRKSSPAFDLRASASDYADNGCLIAYGPGYDTEGKDGARYVDRILKGAKPAELPIEQPTKFELVINLKTAKRIGVALPEVLLNQADRLIQ